MYLLPFLDNWVGYILHYVFLHVVIYGIIIYKNEFKFNHWHFVWILPVGSTLIITLLAAVSIITS